MEPRGPSRAGWVQAEHPKIQDPTKLATVTTLVTIYEQIASTTLPLTAGQKAGWITAAGGQASVLGQHHNWLWEVGAY